LNGWVIPLRLLKLNNTMIRIGANR